MASTILSDPPTIQPASPSARPVGLASPGAAKKTTFEDIPTELVDDIVDYVEDTEDLCRFSMTCTRVKVMVEAVIHTRRRGFRVGPQPGCLCGREGEDLVVPNVRYCGDHRIGYARLIRQNVFTYLLSICRFRMLTSFPTFAYIYTANLAPILNSLIDEEPWVIKPEDQTLIKNALVYLGEGKQSRKQWLSQLRQGNIWSAIKLVLYLLPKLQKVQVFYDDEDEEHMRLEFFKWSSRRTVLRKLETVAFCGPLDDEFAYYKIWPILFQPSVKSLYLHGITRYCKLQLSWPAWAAPSNLTTLIINGANLDAVNLEAILRHTPYLEHLFYSHICHVDHVGPEEIELTSRELQRMFSPLARTLETLQFNMCCRRHETALAETNGDSEQPPDELVLLDFSSFTALKNLWIPWYMLLPWTNDRPAPGSSPLLTNLPHSLEWLRMPVEPGDTPVEAVPAHFEQLLLRELEEEEYVMPNLHVIELGRSFGSEHDDDDDDGYDHDSNDDQNYDHESSHDSDNDSDKDSYHGSDDGSDHNSDHSSDHDHNRDSGHGSDRDSDHEHGHSHEHDHHNEHDCERRRAKKEAEEKRAQQEYKRVIELGEKVNVDVNVQLGLPPFFECYQEPDDNGRSGRTGYVGGDSIDEDDEGNEAEGGEEDEKEEGKNGGEGEGGEGEAST